MTRGSDGLKIVPEDILAEAAEPAFERLRALAATAPPIYEGLLPDMADHLLDPDVNMSHPWARCRLDPSGHTGRLAAHLGAPPWSFLRELRVGVATRLLAGSGAGGRLPRREPTSRA